MHACSVNNNNNNNNNRRLVTLAEHTSDHGKQTNSGTKERGSRARKLLGANAKIYRLKTKTKNYVGWRL